MPLAELGIPSQEVPRLLLDRAYDRDLRTVLSFWALAGTRQFTFRREVQRGLGNFYETWNSAPFLSHVIKISLVGSGSVCTRQEH